MKFRQPERAVDHLQNALVPIARIEAYLEGQDEASFLGNELVEDAGEARVVSTGRAGRAEGRALGREGW
jgi:hypothetical protein